MSFDGKNDSLKVLVAPECGAAMPVMGDDGDGMHRRTARLQNTAVMLFIVFEQYLICVF